VIDYSQLAYPKKVAQVLERAKKKAAEAKEERLAKAAVWKRAASRCERCGRLVAKGADSLTRGDVHHKRFRSKGGTWAAENLILLCVRCHVGAHLGARR
jgi:5-methylcytosine-specific restriction endonuclease McrA